MILRETRADSPALLGRGVLFALVRRRIGARVEHLGAKEALLAADPRVFFTTPHFDGHASILVRLDRIAVDELGEVIVEAWLCRAPKTLAQRYVDTQLTHEE